jgi:hypothetical protein
MGASKIFSKFAKLLDRTTVDLPTLNTPLAEALAAKAASSSLSYVALSGSYDDLIDVPAPSPGVSEVAELTDATTYDFPTLNTPVSDALAAKANSADLGTIATFEGNQNLRTTDPATFAGGIFNGSVGIGTDTPESFLNIVNPATSGNNGSLVIEHTGSNFGAGLKVKGGLNPQIRLESGAIKTKSQISGGVATFGTESNDKFSVITNNTAKLTVDSSGNVGIGTTTPAEKLDVVGNIKASGTVTATGGATIEGTLSVPSALTTDATTKTNLRNAAGLGAGDTLRVATCLIGGVLQLGANTRISGPSGSYLDVYNTGTGNVRVWCGSTNPTYGNVIFGAGNAERMRLHVSGGLSIGSSTDPGTGVTSVLNITASGTVKAGSLTVAVATASSSATAVAAGAGASVYITDEVGGATLAVSDGTVWRRVSDRASIS